MLREDAFAVPPRAVDRAAAPRALLAAGRLRTNVVVVTMSPIFITVTEFQISAVRLTHTHPDVGDLVLCMVLRRRKRET